MEDVFKIRYNNKLDKLEIPKENKGEKIMNAHKFIVMIFTSFVIFSGINFYLIYTFFKILGNV